VASKMSIVLKDQVADILRSEIYKGNIKNGESIKQTEISEKLGVSRMPVREAFLQLEAEGVLHRLQNRHVRVIGMTRKRVRQIFLTISSMEISMAGQSDNIEEIKKAYEAYKGADTRLGYEILVKRVLEFHMSLSKSLDNPYLYQLHERILTGYPMFLYSTFEVDWERLISINTDIYTAILKKNEKSIEASINKYYDYLYDFAVEECDLK